jgi:hypothetical protein
MLAFFVNEWQRHPLYIFAIENSSSCAPPPRDVTSNGSICMHAQGHKVISRGVIVVVQKITTSRDSGI